jgi:hypothetical protein
MRSIIVITAVLVSLLFAGNAGAWSSNGHQTVGAIADTLLQGSRADTEVKVILGKVDGQQLTLEQVSVWPDCVRGIKPSQHFAYNPGNYREASCKIFEDDSDIQEMAGYARRNNTNCEYSGRNSECHKSFHFSDVDIKHNNYKDGYIGTNDHDIVHAISAALAVLKGDPSPAPFNIKSKKEALMLLTHLVGDLHQPLHVGAIYLNANGKRIDPDKDNFDPETDTHGGNNITGIGGNLHHQWDATNFSLDDQSTIADLASQAGQVGATEGVYETWPTVWATDTIVEAQTAFEGLVFDAKTGNGWPMTFENRPMYLGKMKSLQQQQVIKAGARLAELLRALWPD